MAAKKKVGRKSKAVKNKASAVAKKTKPAASSRAATSQVRSRGRPPKKKIEGATAVKSPRELAKKLTVAARGRRKPTAAAQLEKSTTRRGRAAAAKVSGTKSRVKIQDTVIPVSKVAKPVSKTRTKSDVVGVLALATSLSRKEVKSVLNALNELVEYDLSSKGPGDFRFNDLIKIAYVKKKATKSHKGVSPFTGKTITYKAKPARKYIRVRILKSLKNLAS